MTDYVGIDFETANGTPGSICSFGAAWVGDDGAIRTHEIITRLHPDAGVQENTWIHGITSAETLFGEDFAEVQDWLREAYNAGVVLVAHSAFDRTAYVAACRLHGFEPLEFDWVDSLKTSRRVYGLPSNKLSVVAEHLGIEFEHHRADEDARVALEIFLRDGDPKLDALGASGKRKQPRTVEAVTEPLTAEYPVVAGKGRAKIDWRYVLSVGMAGGMVGAALLAVILKVTGVVG
ncbi:DnaQ-like DNA polymerase III subunit [Microbacterium phage Pumpernickel]|uniref:DnaQ-like DNA polymerase III subunit n=1 Tax=Microbacterium phage Pumpernickel TaxID=2885983 RepID=A0AAE8Y7C6_9CAUD|nr:DnaQ-like DNA polymerase III subunit [Microbacterium phage Pumpernickel]UDL16010.1 DnaQ-like DNA polymerase III subunit [Microbacterium phage Pumpernickel]